MTEEIKEWLKNNIHITLTKEDNYRGHKLIVILSIGNEIIDQDFIWLDKNQ